MKKIGEVEVSKEVIFVLWQEIEAASDNHLFLSQCSDQDFQFGLFRIQ
jgi:hypothetical protein